MKSLSIILCLALATFFPSSLRAADPTAEVKLELVPEGAMRKLCGYMPQQLKLNAAKPATVKKAADSKTALYGTIQFAGVRRLVVLDEPEGEDAKLYVVFFDNAAIT